MTQRKSSLRAFVYKPAPIAVGATGSYGYVQEPVVTKASAAVKKQYLLRRKSRRLALDNPWQHKGLEELSQRAVVATVKAWAGGNPVTAEMFVELDDSDTL